MMNDKIKELATVAGAEVYQIDAGYGIVSRMALFDDDIQKFAELLIKQCMSICRHEAVSSLDIDDILNGSKKQIQDLATNSCGEHLSDRIGKRFGVSYEE